MSVIAWQGLRLTVPARWSPVKVEGDYAAGYALLADLHRPRLGLRWSTPRTRKLDVAAVVKKRLLEEVGMLAAEEARPLHKSEEWTGGMVYIEPEPPGRDVWIGYSRRSRRVVEVIHHAHRRERILEGSILPALQDTPESEPIQWSIFDLSCAVDRDLPLERQRLNAGDLSLSFGDAKRSVFVRQIAVAELALQRQPLEKWLQDQQRVQRKQYRPANKVEPAEIVLGGRPTSGFVGRLRRRRRFVFMRWIATAFVTYALHDRDRDRIVIVQATDDELARRTCESVGWATEVNEVHGRNQQV